ncbi:unnamed protein product [Closterium sp. Naga37s-1]|nr:unnamed protein product [Closterium sp. Naga37s-1]
MSPASYREALAVKDAATSNPDLDMVDKVVRTVAAELGKSCVWSQRFKYLQRVIYNTNLEVQGIHTVRWLSRGDAVRRLCKVLGACIVLLWENSHKAYEIVTNYKFQFCLFFLDDILADMNNLNRCFQKRDSTTADLTERYLDNDKPFSGESKCWLVGFLQLHGQGGGKKVRVRGVDGEGRPINHLYTMHERQLPGHKSMRRRRPAKSAKLAVAERGRKGKAKEGEDEAGTAGQNEEEEGEEEEEDVEQELGDDRDLVGEEEDNPFLSDDEDVEEVFHIDKTVH